MDSSVFSVENLTVGYGDRPVLVDVSVQFQRGRLIGIMGPNGSGKSTLIKAALNLMPRWEGKVFAFGQPFTGFHPSIAYVPQRESVDWDFPVSVEEVVLMGTYHEVPWFRRPGFVQHAKVLEALCQVDLLEYRNRQISQLSGGQQQRTFIARALAQDAEIYLMDEPFAGVDAQTEGMILEVFRMMRSKGKTVIAVHHQLSTMEEYFDDLLLLQGRVLAFGETEKVLRSPEAREVYGRLADLWVKE